jgi:hypothetical protein
MSIFSNFFKKEAPLLGLQGSGGGLGFLAGRGAASIEATGGAVTNSGSYTIHTFSFPNSDNFEVTSGEGEIDILVIAGGGAGGSGGPAGWHGGGGGAGGYAYATGYTVTPGTYPIAVGGGGSGNAAGRGSSGGNSWFNLPVPSGKIFCQGGGGGGVGAYPGVSSDAPAYNGGSGGGAGAHLDSSTSGGGTSVQPGQNSTFTNGTLEQYGFPGGDETGGTGDGRGGGGGGAGGAGQPSPGGSPNGGGGAGRENSITGSAVTYAGGAPTYPGDTHPAPGAAGSGGQGAASGGTSDSGQSGVVIVRYLT